MKTKQVFNRIKTNKLMNMHHKFYCSALIVVAFTRSALFAQSVPNGSFENWTTTITTEANGWGSLNWLKIYGYPETTIQTTDAHSGNYAMKIETVMSGADTIDGFSFTGIWQPMVDPLFGFACTSRPVKLKGFYKYSSQLNDSCSVIAWLTKWNSSLNQADTIASGSFIGHQQKMYFQVSHAAVHLRTHLATTLSRLYPEQRYRYS